MTPLWSWVAGRQPLVNPDFYFDVWNLQKKVNNKKTSLFRAKISLEIGTRNQFLKLRLRVKSVRLLLF